MVNQNYEFDTESFSPEEAKQALQDIFSDEAKTFEELQSRPWYKNFISAITFHHNDKKMALKGIRSIVSLQKIFMDTYCNQYVSISQDFETLLEQVMTNRCALQNLNEEVQNIYYALIARPDEQEDPRNMETLGKQILLQSLAAHEVPDDVSEEAQKYRMSLAKRMDMLLPTSELDFAQFDNLSKRDSRIIYRCMRELLCIVQKHPDNLTTECDTKIFDNLSVSSVAKDNIEQHIQYEIKTFGKQYLLEKYDIPDISIDENDFSWIEDEPDCLEDEPQSDCRYERVNFEDSPQDKYQQLELDSEGYDQIKTSEMPPIEFDESLECVHKVIHFDAKVKCSGALKFEECIIHYNEKEANGEANDIGLELLSRESFASFERCKIIGHGYSPEFFIKVKDISNGVTFENCEFLNCYNFIMANNEKSNVAMSGCFIKNPGTFFVRSGGTFTLKNGRIEIEKTIPFKPAGDERIPKEVGIENLSTCDTPVFFCNNIDVENCKINSKYEVQTQEVRARYSISLFDISKGIIDQTEFCGVSHAIKIGSGIMVDWRKANYFIDLQLDELAQRKVIVSHCSFDNCEDIIDNKFSECEVSNCHFNNCTIAVTGSRKSEIINCEFNRCYNNVIASGYYGNVHIRSCKFIKWIQKEGAQRSDLIRLFMDNGKKSKNNSVENCRFVDSTAATGYLIYSATGDKIKTVVTEIEFCEFINCQSGSPGQMLRNTFERVKPKIGLQKTVRVSNMASCSFTNCTGK